MRKVAVVGAGLTRFMRRAQETGPELAWLAASQALESCGLTLKDVGSVALGSAPDAFDGVHMKGEYLSMIAGYGQIYGDTMKWPRLYRANRDQIEDPDLIYPDQVLNVPHGYPTWHVVVQDEFLSKIANYWEIYDDGREWPRIYEANKDQIRDPDMVYPDQVLTIPR